MALFGGCFKKNPVDLPGGFPSCSCLFGPFAQCFLFCQKFLVATGKIVLPAENPCRRDTADWLHSPKRRAIMNKNDLVFSVAGSTDRAFGIRGRGILENGEREETG